MLPGMSIVKKGNNKITELRTIFQTENCENRNDPDLVQAFLKKWWVESDFKAPKCGSTDYWTDNIFGRVYLLH